MLAVCPDTHIDDVVAVGRLGAADRNQDLAML